MGVGLLEEAEGFEEARDCVIPDQPFESISPFLPCAQGIWRVLRVAYYTISGMIWPDNTEKETIGASQEVAVSEASPCQSSIMSPAP